MPRNYLAFDIEVATGFPIDAADWRPCRPLGISCAATLAAGAPEPRLWHGGRPGAPADRMTRQEAAALVAFLAAAAEEGYTILTWNGLGFDFDVLAEEADMLESCARLAGSHVDMMWHAFCALGFPVGLESAARGMKLPGKTEGIRGIDAPRLWARGKRQEILDYVARDVRATLDLALACEKAKRLTWITRQGKRRDLALRSGWLDVEAAGKLPLPDTSWMPRPMARRKFTAWMGKSPGRARGQ